MPLKKILLVGASLQSGNKGVNALTRGSINALLDNYEGQIKIQILSYTVHEYTQNTIRYNNENYIIEEYPCNPYDGLHLLKLSLYKSFLGIELLSKSNEKIKVLYELVRNADIIYDLSEGDSFSDIYGMKRFIIHSTVKISSIRLKKKLILLPQTIGPFKNIFVKRIAKYILNNTYFNFVRDSISEKVIVKDLHCRKAKVEYIPDMAFYMNPIENISLINAKEYFSDGTTKIGINVSGLLYNGGYTKNNMFGFKTDYKVLINEIIEYFMQMQDTKILLVPHVIPIDMPVENDLEVSKIIAEEYKDKYKNRIFYVDKDLREDEIKGIISQCDFFVGGRMHACIAAISSYVPTVPIAYSRKFIGIWENIGLEDCIADPRNKNLEDLLNIVKLSYINKGEIESVLKSKIIQNKDKILGMFKFIGE